MILHGVRSRILLRSRSVRVNKIFNGSLVRRSREGPGTRLKILGRKVFCFRLGGTVWDEVLAESFGTWLVLLHSPPHPTPSASPLVSFDFQRTSIKNRTQRLLEWQVTRKVTVTVSLLFRSLGSPGNDQRSTVVESDTENRFTSSWTKFLWVVSIILFLHPYREKDDILTSYTSSLSNSHTIDMCV